MNIKRKRSFEEKSKTALELSSSFLSPLFRARLLLLLFWFFSSFQRIEDRFPGQHTPKRDLGFAYKRVSDANFFSTTRFNKNEEYTSVISFLRPIDQLYGE